MEFYCTVYVCVCVWVCGTQNMNETFRCVCFDDRPHVHEHTYQPKLNLNALSPVASAAVHGEGAAAYVFLACLMAAAVRSAGSSLGYLSLNAASSLSAKPVM